MLRTTKAREVSWSIQATARLVDCFPNERLNLHLARPFFGFQASTLLSPMQSGAAPQHTERRMHYRPGPRSEQKRCPGEALGSWRLAQRQSHTPYDEGANIDPRDRRRLVDRLPDERLKLHLARPFFR